MSVADIALAMGATLVNAEADAPRLEQAQALRVTSDSRLIEKGDCFVAIAGQHFDGHEFALEALERGAVCVVLDRPVPELHEGEISELPGAVLLVQNTVTALGRLAARHRELTRARVVGVTGSAGKTTVKETLAHILSLEGATAKNRLNLNNQIGLPLSMLRADGDESFWVFELGISKPHDMGELAPILTPDLGLVVNVGPAHTEGLGSLAGVARHKAELLAHVREGGTALVSMDYPELAEAVQSLGTRLCARVVGFSAHTRKDVPYSGHYLGPEPDGQGRYHFRLDGEEFDLLVPCRGSVMAENGAAVAAAAHLLGLSAETIARGLATFAPPEQRFVCQSMGTLTLVNDAYNANPLSMARSLESAAELAGSAPLILVLGAMGELGSESAAQHRELGRLAAQVNAAALFWHGAHCEDIRAGLAEASYQGIIEPAPEPADLPERLAELDLTEGVVLIKGSRALGMERYAEGLGAALSLSDTHDAAHGGSR